MKFNIETKYNIYDKVVYIGKDKKLIKSLYGGLKGKIYSIRPFIAKKRLDIEYYIYFYKINSLKFIQEKDLKLVEEGSKNE